MHLELQEWLGLYRAQRAFDADKWIETKTAQLNKYMEQAGLKACMVSLSGGIDSAVTLGLLKRASKRPGSPIQRVVGVSQPIHSSAWAYNRAKECADGFETEFYVVDQTEIYNQLHSLVETQLHTQGTSFARGQLKSYLRTPVSYYVSQIIGRCLVVGTGNGDEDGYLAYFCKAGDGVCDVQLISDLHKSEVFAVGRQLGVPQSILQAAPSADLWEGQTDEEELGFSYDFVELYTGLFVGNPLVRQPHDLVYPKEKLDTLSSEARAEFDHHSFLIDAVHRRNKHKLVSPNDLLKDL